MLLASGSADGTVRLWDPATGAVAGALLTGPRAGQRRERQPAAAYPDRPTATHRVRHADGGQQVRERTDDFRAY